jgi:SAM-dependent methyltransferase
LSYHPRLAGFYADIVAGFATDIDSGYRVTAFDRSETMVQHATAYAGVEVRQRSFQDLSDEAAYDGIWCCASLLHVPMVEFSDVLQRLTRALKPNAVLYMSYKYGEGERTVGGRQFTDHTEASLSACLTPDLKVLEMWKTRDARPLRSNEFWLNTLVRCSGEVGNADVR